MYNLVQFLGFSWIFVNLTVRLFILGQGLFGFVLVWLTLHGKEHQERTHRKHGPGKSSRQGNDELLSNGDTTAQPPFALQIMRLLNVMQCVCVCVTLCRFLLRYLPHRSRHDVFLPDDGRAGGCKSALGSGQDWLFPCYDPSKEPLLLPAFYLSIGGS